MRKLPQPGFYGILDTRWVAPEQLPLVAGAFLAGGCRILQLRMKDASDQSRLATQRDVSAVAGKFDETVWIAVNDRADLAKVMALEAPGNVEVILHLGQDDIPPSVARDLVGDEMVIGLSTHNADQVRHASSEDIDYLGYGPVYPTLTKSRPDPTTGVDGLVEALQIASKPVVAIGGVTRDRAPALRRHGAHWVVVVRDLLEGVDLSSDMGVAHLQ